jgi:small-conductance mechanosensitive channel
VWAQSPTPSPTDQAPAEVRLNQLVLFQLESLGQISAEERRQILSERLQGLLHEEQPPFVVKATPEETNYLLSCRGRYLVTVTPVDAQAAGVDVSTLAANWSSRLQRSLQRAYLESSDEYYKYALWNAGWAILIATLLHPLIKRLCLRYLHTPGLSPRSLLWLTTCIYCLHQFPKSRFLSLALQRYALYPLLLLAAVLLVTGLISWVLRRLTRYYFLQTERLRSRSHHNSPRWRQRLHMMRDVSQFVLSALLTCVAIVVYFTLLDLNLGAVLAGAGFIGVALGFAAQDVLKDYTAGLNIMVEDQFGAGDTITVCGFTGVVEHFTLRVTQLRDMGGSLITIPNSQIRLVQNQSNLWSQVDLTLPLEPGTDLRRALQLMEETANQLRKDRPEDILEPAQVLGVESVGAYSVDLRILLKTAPHQQFPIRRELLLRLLEACQAQGIQVATQSMRLLE